MKSLHLFFQILTFLMETVFGDCSFKKEHSFSSFFKKLRAPTKITDMKTVNVYDIILHIILYCREFGVELFVCLWLMEEEKHECYLAKHFEHFRSRFIPINLMLFCSFPLSSWYAKALKLKDEAKSKNFVTYVSFSAAEGAFLFFKMMIVLLSF